MTAHPLTHSTFKRTFEPTHQTSSDSHTLHLLQSPTHILPHHAHLPVLQHFYNVLTTGAAHLYFRPFENLSPWGGSGWRDRRQVPPSPPLAYPLHSNPCYSDFVTHKPFLKLSRLHPFIHASFHTLHQPPLHRYSRIPLYLIAHFYIPPHFYNPPHFSTYPSCTVSLFSVRG